MKVQVYRDIITTQRVTYNVDVGWPAILSPKKLYCKAASEGPILESTIVRCRVKHGVQKHGGAL